MNILQNIEKLPKDKDIEPLLAIIMKELNEKQIHQLQKFNDTINRINGNVDGSFHYFLLLSYHQGKTRVMKGVADYFKTNPQVKSVIKIAEFNALNAVNTIVSVAFRHLSAVFTNYMNSSG